MNSTKQHILVTGANGQLGSALRKLHTSFTEQFHFTFTTSADMDFSSTESMATYLADKSFNYIINCAAYTAVDQAEEERDLADKINHLAVAQLAQWCNHHKAKLIHISTDYVFDGMSQDPIPETAATAPINVYGQTKLDGERACFQMHTESIVIRTAWVYSEYGHNFVKTMLRLMQERPALNIVNDQLGSPTYAGDLAAAILTIVSGSYWKSGIYHYANGGQISWYDFAKAIQELSGYTECILTGVPSTAYPTPAKRPNYSLLNTEKIKATFHIEIPYYKDSLLKMVNGLMIGKADR
ncbi:dTDP-4-dehydrorhamnose reductase [Zhouia sp. PK063]|uniref:dTDP-4-dehydrorhamnose reductase n=1 Tax=Zhouia sp. PK063 TaxID=3373602 RepID=UPI0037B712F9